MFITKKRACFIAVLFLFAFVCPTLWAQYREYIVSGSIVDKDQAPISGAEIKLHEQTTSKNLASRSDKNGNFEFVGIPHGIYDATISKQGFVSISSVWKFEVQQDRMQKVSVPTVVLLTEAQSGNIKSSAEVQAEIDKANEKVRNGDYDGAISILRPVLEKHPDDANALYLNGVSLYNKHDYDGAISELLKVVAAKETFAPAYMELGLCYQQNKMPDKALDAYKKALELDPANVSAGYNAGMVLFADKKPAQALEFLESAFNIKQDDADIAEAISYCYLQLRDVPKSIEYLNRALSLTKDDAKRRSLQEQIQKLNGGQKADQ